MSDYVFLFDLDATITRVEILPELSRELGMYDKMRDLTEKTMRGEIPFRDSFLERVNLLKNLPISQVADFVENIPLNDKLADFIMNNNERCYIVTGNLDVWIQRLMIKLKVSNHVFCSTTSHKEDKLLKVNSVIDKAKVIEQFISPVVAVGDGSNDSEMIGMAQIGIGYGGVRPVAYSTLCNSKFAIYEEGKLCQFLQRLL
ncbi:HAD-IB family phosphatase [Vallitalea okinawensis]|uniref:HAD-IB family phosphatase n=1 Tax=Vallitalea okinawensis TaxID=2078660 RepID=UPI000CFDA6FE|nr:HAD-IB family phosphatase [Vallitalea okinawensis]